MKNLFERILWIYKDVIEHTSEHNEAVRKLQQNEDEFSSVKVARRIADAENDYRAFRDGAMQECVDLVGKIIERAGERENDFDISTLNAVIAYITASGDKCDHNIVERQIKAFRGIPQAVQAILSVCEANNCRPDVLGVVKSYNFSLDDVTNSLGRNISATFSGSIDFGEASKSLCRIAETLGVDITTDNYDPDGMQSIFRRIAGIR